MMNSRGAFNAQSCKRSATLSGHFSPAPFLETFGKHLIPWILAHNMRLFREGLFCPQGLSSTLLLLASRLCCPLTFVRLLIEDPEYAKESCPAPIVQCLQVKPISAAPSGVTRWRAVLSDGKYWIQTMLARSAGPIADDGELVKGCICRITGCMPVKVKDKM
jgi:hypothetical protein